MHILHMQMLPYLGNQQQCSKNKKKTKSTSLHFSLADFYLMGMAFKPHFTSGGKFFCDKIIHIRFKASSSAPYSLSNCGIFLWCFISKLL